MTDIDESLIGMAFFYLVGGIFFCLLVLRIHERGWRARLITAAVFVGLFVLAFVTMPSRSERGRRYALMFQSDSTIVQSIDILPLYDERDPRAINNLVQEPLQFADKFAIDQFCAGLRDVRYFHPNHPSEQWSCKVRMHTADEVLTFEVTKTRDEKNGTFVAVYYGWLRQTYRCDEFAIVLETLTAPYGSEEARN